MPTPWIAPSNAFGPHPQSNEWAPFLYRRYHIVRAGRRVPTGGGKERCDGVLIEPDGQDQQSFQEPDHTCETAF